MTDRERWTVYPLLFMTLGIALTGRLTNTVTTKEVVCDKLVCGDVQCTGLLVTDHKGHEQVAIFSNPAGGQIRTQGNLTKIRAVVGSTERVSGLLLFDEGGRVLRGSSLAAPPPPPVAEPPAEEHPTSTPEQAPEASESKLPER